MRSEYVAFTFDAILSLAAFWLPRTAAAVTAASWVFWLADGLGLKHE